MLAEYIWLGGQNELRSKTRVIESEEDITLWNYDGSSTGQVAGSDSDV